MRKKSIIAFVLVFIFMFSVVLTAQAAVMGNTQITFERAVEIARNAAGGGQVKEVEWELKNGNPRYEVKVYFDGRKHEIRIDAVTGDLTKHTSKATNKTVTGITVSQLTSAKATELADAALAASNGGTVTEIEFELKNGVLICEIEINNNGTKHEFRFNVSTSELLKHSSKAPKNGNSSSRTINHLR